MPYRFRSNRAGYGRSYGSRLSYRGRFRRRNSRNLVHRQGGTGATFSGSQDIIRHAASTTGTIQTGYSKALPLVIYNPTKHGTPVSSAGSSAKVLSNNYTTDGSRVDYVTIQLTLKQTDTTKNNTCYIGTISTSFNEGRLSDALMKINYGTGTEAFIEDEGDGEMDVNSDEEIYNLNTYSLNDIQQHNIKGVLSPQFQLYSGRVVTANQTVPLPFKNRRQQEGSLFALFLMNDSNPEGSDVDYRLDTFFKEIPSNPV